MKIAKIERHEGGSTNTHGNIETTSLVQLGENDDSDDENSNEV